MQVLPFAQDRWLERYLVIPTLGIVVPIQSIPSESTDFSRMVNGKSIDLNKYLQHGILHYPMSPDVGHEGNMVVF
jgi:hypothetical protein